ncbi:MAG: tetratricopeptide repeat protein, partial [Ktedonobacteraceae bacterium]|nr:tetratricopeptide repeat protein [Ktedonobacteraceae bacterium]
MSTQRGRSATPYYIPSTSVQAQTPARPPSGGGTAATRQQPVQRSQARRWHQTLKGQFLLLASAGMLMAVVLALFTSLSFRRAADDLHTIPIDSIPSVNAAQ